MTGLLKGITVVDFSRVLAGPYATSMLADHGADVLKVETPGHGDDSRHLGPFDSEGKSTYFSGLNRGKRSIELNLKDPEHHAKALELIADADVVVENFRPGVADKLGVGFDAAKEVNPGIVYASISGFGQSGSATKKPAYDTVIQALSGLMEVTGFPEGEATRVGESIADVSAGVFAAFGIAAALVRRDRTGEAAHLDIPMYDVMVAMQPTNAAQLAATGVAPKRVGNRHPVTAPFDTYHAADGLFVIAVANDRLFAVLAEALGKPELVRDPRFTTDSLRSANDEALRVEIEAAVAGRTVAQMCELLGEAGVPTSPVQDFREAAAGELGTERGLIREDARSGHSYIAHPILVDGERPASDLPVPELGEHN